jgi:hypothetical protein
MSTDDPSRIDAADDNQSAPTNKNISLAPGEFFDRLGFWFYSWLGTVAAGGLFGLLLGGLEFLVDGIVLAAIGALICQLIAAFLTWLLRLSRFRVVMTALAGVTTGITSTNLVFSILGNPDFFNISFWPSVILAGLLGALGSSTGGFCWLAWLTRQGVDIGHRGRQMTRCDVWKGIGVFAATVVVVGYLIVASQRAQQNTMQVRCAGNLKQIGVLLEMYNSSHGCLPAAYLTDAAGKSVLSWRVRAAEFYSYELNFSERMDFSRPWNSPANSKFLDFFALKNPVFQCPATTKKDKRITEYVAIVGPGTLWPGKEPGKLPKKTKNGGEGKGKSQILVVEWPKSDIHWAEPRDITVEEFLDWFRSKPGRWDSNHSGCILYVDAAGEVGEIPNDTDPETVRKLLTGGR